MAGRESRSTALITPSYAADFERCRLLCDSVDSYVEDQPDHYLLVDDEDYALFAPLAGKKRHVINERDILPSWLYSIRPGLFKSSRKMWVSLRTWPLRGWHVQQLRRIAIAQHVRHDGLLYCDSDMLFVKPFSTTSLWRKNAFRLYRKDNGINSSLPGGGKLHFDWTRHAARLNGLARPKFPSHDYINNLVSWRRADVIDMCSRIEETSSKHWIAAIASSRSFSECQIYGAYVDGVLGGKGHWLGQGGLCQTYWSGEAMTREAVTGFVGGLENHQVAIGVQSFTNTDTRYLRELIAA